MAADPDALRARLAALAADPSWSPALRAAAKTVDPATLDPADPADQGISDALMAALQRRGESAVADDLDELRARLCLAPHVVSSGASWCCNLPAGHDGAHDDGCGDQWIGSPTPEQVTAAPDQGRHPGGRRMTATTTVPTEQLRVLFDVAVGSMNFASGFLDGEEVEALRAIAVALGVDPVKATPKEFWAQYPHPYLGPSDFSADPRVWWQCEDVNCTRPADDPIHQSPPAQEAPA